MYGDGYIPTYKSGSQKRKQQNRQQEAAKGLSNFMLKYFKVRQENDNANAINKDSAANIHDDEENVNLSPHNQNAEDNDSEVSKPSHRHSASGADPSTDVSISPPDHSAEKVGPHFSGDPAEWMIEADFLEYKAYNLPNQNCVCDY